MMWFFRHFWIFISYHIFLLNQVEGAIAIPPSNTSNTPLPLFCPSVCPSVCPSIGLLTTFSGFCTFADKSLGRNGIELEMQMFPDDLPLANIDADGYCCHFMRSSVRPTIHGLGFVYCIQSAWKKWPTIWHADVSRWLTLSIHGCLWILLLVCLSVHLSVCSFTLVQPFGFFWVFLLFFFIFFSKVRVGAKEGGSHYWEMAVAITCGYGGYLLPLLAAHSSCISRKPKVPAHQKVQRWLLSYISFLSISTYPRFYRICLDEKMQFKMTIETLRNLMTIWALPSSYEAGAVHVNIEWVWEVTYYKIFHIKFISPWLISIADILHLLCNHSAGLKSGNQILSEIDIGRQLQCRDAIFKFMISCNKEKTVLLLSCLCKDNPYTCKRPSL